MVGKLSGNRTIAGLFSSDDVPREPDAEFIHALRDAAQDISSALEGLGLPAS